MVSASDQDNPGAASTRGGAAGAGAATATGVLTLILTLLGWSAVPLFITHFAKTLDAWTSNGWRYGFSALIWAPVLLWQAGRGGLPRGLWRAAVWPAVFNGLGQVAFTLSFYATDPTSATFGLRAQIVFVALGAYALFPSERDLLRRKRAWAAIGMVVLGISGTILLAPGAREGMGRSQTHVAGVVLAVASGLLFAAYGLSVRRKMTGYHPVTAFAAISQYTAAGMVGLMLLLGREVTTGAWDGGASAWWMPGGQFALLLLSSVIGIALGHVFYYIALARLGVAVTSGVIQLQPFCVAVGSYFVLGKAVTAGQIGSGSIALAGAVLLLGTQWAVSRQARQG